MVKELSGELFELSIWICLGQQGAFYAFHQRVSSVGARSYRI